ncbi:hypothetical protein F4861DRAFT_206998 [Xylaria intraflava]|nr:hypothetical protein F4861DRAFT_206998 [Xylaria intraflava]
MSRYEDGYPPRGSNTDYYAYSRGVRGAAETYSPNPHQLRLTYKPEEAAYTTRSQSEAQRTPRSHAQLESLSSRRDRNRDRGYYQYSDEDDSEDEIALSPIEKAKRFLDNIFTDSMTGLGVGVLGALVGGLAGREAVDLTSNQQHHHHKRSQEDDDKRKRNQLIGTVVGATVGALGANAVEKRIELRRARDEIEHERRERRWRESADGDMMRPRSKGHSHHSHHWEDWDAAEDRGRGDSGGNGYELEREVDLGNHSWNTVEDWVLGGSNSGEHDHDYYDHDHDRSDRRRPSVAQSHGSYHH